MSSDFFTRPPLGVSSSEYRTKKASGQTIHASIGGGYGGFNNAPLGSSFPSNTDGPGVSRTPSRKWYDPEYTALSLLLPKNRPQKNRWRRYFDVFDPVVGGVIELHSQMPFSTARLFGIDDKQVLRKYEQANEEVSLWAKLPEMCKEFLKIGEAFPYLRWDDSKGYFSHIILQNQDFIEIEQSLFVEEEDKYFLSSDPRIRTILEGDEPTYRDRKSRLPVEFLRSIFYGEKIPLPFDDKDLFFALIKRGAPNDIRGTSIIDRLFKYLIYEDKLLDAQTAIADNFIFPLRMFKLGNENWTPNPEQLDAFQEILMNKQFDPNFYLLTHNAVTYESHNLASDVMSLANEWDRIDKVKMIGLGISQTFLTGESSYASAHVAFQTAIERYRTLRSFFETEFLAKYFKTIAERNEFYKPSPRELNGQYRVANREKELLIPKLDWSKKLVVREEETYLNFLAGLMGKFPIAESTFFSALGVSLEDELLRKVEDDKLKTRLGIKLEKDFGSSSKKEGEEEGEEKGLFSWFKRDKKRFASSEEKYLYTVAKNIHNIQKKEGGAVQSVDVIYHNLISSSDKITDPNFLVGEAKQAPLNQPRQADSVNATTVETYSEETFYSFSENYYRNKNNNIPKKLYSALSDFSNLLETDYSNEDALLSVLGEIIKTSYDDASTYINNRSQGIDREFIYSFLKSDVFDEFHRAYDKESINKDTLKKIALSASVLGYAIHYSNERVDEIIVHGRDGIKKLLLNSVISSGVNSVSKIVDSGILPKIYPGVSFSESDDFVKAGYVSDFKIAKTTFSQCPRFLVDYVKDYFVIFSNCLNSKFSNVTFVQDVSKHKEFLNYVKSSYGVKDDADLEFLLQNEKRKISSKKIFYSDNSVYLNYDLVNDFSSFFDFLNYVFPYDKEKVYSKYYNNIVDSLPLYTDGCTDGVRRGWLKINSGDNSLEYRVVGGEKDVVHACVDFYDGIGVPIILDKDKFLKSFIQGYFDRRYLYEDKISSVLEKG